MNNALQSTEIEGLVDVTASHLGPLFDASFRAGTDHQGHLSSWSAFIGLHAFVELGWHLQILQGCATLAAVNQMQTRQARAELTAYTLDLQRRTIPANAVLHDFRVGPGHEGLARHNPKVASFHYEGEVHFNVAHEIISGTVVVNVA